MSASDTARLRAELNALMAKVPPWLAGANANATRNYVDAMAVAKKAGTKAKMEIALNRLKVYHQPQGQP